MKKNIIIISITIISILFNCSCRENNSRQENMQEENKLEYILVDSLSLNDYSTYEGYLPSKGFIPTPEIAVQIAEPILKCIYGKEQIEKQKPFLINEENDIWIIEGYWNRNEGKFGGNAYMEINKMTGEILKVIHTK